VHTIYNLAVHITSFFLKIIVFFSPKIKYFINGRKDTFSYLEKHISKNDSIIWVHTASLGEFEQGLPVIEKLRAVHPSYKILLTFFSPSGYKVKKNTSAADVICYLPLDTKQNARRFLDLAHPKIALFVKYEIWPNYINELKKNNIPMLLISAIFKKEQVFFKWYGSFMRKVLKNISYFFVQDSNSELLLNTIGLANIVKSGDTRFDRVSEILERDNTLPFMDQFKQHGTCLVAGSTWPEDEEVLVDYINTSDKNIRYVLAPHNIKLDHIKNLRKSISKKTILYSEIKEKNLAGYSVLIMDTIGLLTKIYSYSDIAYVGGAFATGLHNTLEPAVFGVPVIIGPNYKGFKEAEELVRLQGILVIKDRMNFTDIINQLLENEEFCKNTGSINASYVGMNTGASIQIVDHIRTLL